MASNGVISNAFRTGYKVQISWVVNSQNIANNTSNVTVNAQLVSTGSAYTISSSATKYGSLTVNGVTYNFTFSASLSGGQTKTVFTKTVDIPHDSSGSKTLSMSTKLGINVTLSGVYWGDVTASGSGVLNDIPRTSSISLNTTTGTIGSTQFTVTINRASTSFTHKVYYKFGSINVLINGSATTSASFTPSLGDCSEIPNSTSGTGTVLVETYNGSTLIGSTSQNITLSIPSSVKPSFTSLTQEIIAAGAATSYGYIKGKSKCKLTINGAIGMYGSVVKSYYISGGGFSSTTNPFTTEPLTTSGTVTFSAYVVDSRGVRSDTKTVSISVQDYMNPNISTFSVTRCTSSGVANEDGTYIKINASYSYTTLGGSNTISSKVEYKVTTNSVWVNAGSISSGGSLITGSGNIAATNAYDVRITLTDKFTTITRSIVIPTAFMTMDFRKGGKGVAIGKASEYDNLFDIAMNIRVQKDYGILRDGVGKSWVAGAKGDGCAMNMDTYPGGYSPFIRQKSASGAWTFGTYLNDTYHLTFLTDSYMASNTNVVNTQYSFPTTGKTVNVLGIDSGSVLNYDTMIINTESVQASKGLIIKGSGGPTANLWVGTGGAVLMTTGNHNLHLGRNNSTTDFTINEYNLQCGKPVNATQGVYSDTFQYQSSAGWNSAWGIGFQCHIMPTTGSRYCGTSSYRWQGFYSVTAINVSSDETLKEDIYYLPDKSDDVVSTYSIDGDGYTLNPKIDNLTTSDFLSFIRDDLKIATFNYKLDTNTLSEEEAAQAYDMRSLQVGFIAQDLVDTKVGGYIVTKDSEGILGYETGNYATVIAGALQEEIKIRESEIYSLKQIVYDLQNQINNIISKGDC